MRCLGHDNDAGWWDDPGSGRGESEPSQAHCSKRSTLLWRQTTEVCLYFFELPIILYFYEYMYMYRCTISCETHAEMLHIV